MESGARIARVASLVGDPARANMLAGLMDGRALTASVLAHVARITPQTASGHLAKLTEAGLLTRETQGRHRYFRLASPIVGRMLEGLMVAAQPATARPCTPWRKGEALRTARTCYDHLAGRIAVAITDSLVSHDHLHLDGDGGALTEAGHAFLHRLGVALPPAGTRRVFCRPCLDWSERRPHLAGAVGAALLDHALRSAWVQRVPHGRALTVTPAGRAALADAFGADMAALVAVTVLRSRP